MSMVLFQANFYTDVFGITATAAAAVLLIARAWDALVDPIVGYLADRTRTRWGKFRPWILATAVPWSVLMVLAYTRPSGLSATELVWYAIVTNALLMSVYSMNNMPYAALGSVITSDVDERAKLNACRFISVNIAQFVVGGLTLPLVAKFSAGHDRQYGWQITTGIWAALCLVLFLVTFATTRERVSSAPRQEAASIKLDIATLLRCRPWVVMLALTIVQFGLLSFRGSALYDYYHYYAAEPSMYGVLHALGLTLPADGQPSTEWTQLLSALGYIVRSNGQGVSSNVADVFNSIVNVLNTVVTIGVLLASPALSRRFGRKAVAITGFSLAAVATFLFYALRPTDTWSMIALTAVIAACYAPTVSLLWAMYADVTDYIEWTVGRRLDGVTFATIGVALKIGLACGSSAFLWVMVGFFHYNTRLPEAPGAVRGFRVCATLIAGLLIALCALAVAFYELDKRATLRMADELAARRKLGRTRSESSAGHALRN
jgi:Na+/melibiose symporter-like transporter